MSIEHAFVSGLAGKEPVSLIFPREGQRTQWEDLDTDTGWNDTYKHFGSTPHPATVTTRITFLVGDLCFPLLVGGGGSSTYCNLEQRLWTCLCGVISSSVNVWEMTKKNQWHLENHETVTKTATWRQLITLTSRNTPEQLNRFQTFAKWLCVLGLVKIMINRSTCQCFMETRLTWECLWKLLNQFFNLFFGSISIFVWNRDLIVAATFHKQRKTAEIPCFLCLHLTPGEPRDLPFGAWKLRSWKMWWVTWMWNSEIEIPKKGGRRIPL